MDPLLTRTYSYPLFTFKYIIKIIVNIVGGLLKSECIPLKPNYSIIYWRRTIHTPQVDSPARHQFLLVD
jgi:hypothetical protein